MYFKLELEQAQIFGASSLLGSDFKLRVVEILGQALPTKKIMSFCRLYQQLSEKIWKKKSSSFHEIKTWVVSGRSLNYCGLSFGPSGSG